MEDRETARMRKYGERKTTRIMMANVPHVTSGSGLRKFQDDGFLLDRVYVQRNILAPSVTTQRVLCVCVCQWATRHCQPYINSAAQQCFYGKFFTCNNETYVGLHAKCPMLHVHLLMAFVRPAFLKLWSEDHCPCGPFRLNISPKKTEKIKLTWIAYHTL